jgi:cytochrome c-type biogenesis protein CcmH
MKLYGLVLLVSLSTACNHDEPPPAAPGLDVSDLPPPPSGTIKGQLELSPALKDKVKPGETIYLIARNAATGGIVAVQKIAAPKTFPMYFELTGQNVMMPGGSLSGKLKLTVRADQDGDAGSKSPGDVVGEVKDLVTVPAENVTITLDTVL